MKISNNTLFKDIRSHEISDRARVSTISRKEYTILDIETTGMHSDITELAALRIRSGEIKACFHTLVKPKGKMEKRVVELTGITPSLVKKAPVIADVLPGFIRFLGDDILMGHGLDSDLIILDRNLLALGKPLVRNSYVDTNTLSRQVIPEELVEKKYSVQRLCLYYQLPYYHFHRALADCKAEKAVFEALVKDRKSRKNNL